ncbi:MAG: trimethylamine methyltransferase family protein [Anaerolineales bacterium]|nr:MAG: trimethylamine methyltransferase family protein [Anaerolineales bacterium]
MTQRILPIDTTFLRLQVLSPDDVGRIHEATLDLIETVGVRFPSEQALDILHDHGASVDREKQIARIPGHLIEEAMSKAPAGYTLCARENPDLDLPLDGRHAYLAVDGTGVDVLDPHTGEKRVSSKADVANAMRVADYMEEIALVWPPVSAQDCPSETRGLHELDAAWNNFAKHLQTETLVTVHEMEAAIDMAAALVGGRDELRRRPILSIMQCTISPLAHDGGSIDASLVAAEAGLPVAFMTMASCGFSGPAALAGNLVVGNAEVISGLALMEMAYPGCPVYYAAAQTAMDPRTGAYTGGGPEDYLFGAATNHLADFYRIPLSMGAFATGSKQPDWQAALDNVFAGIMPVLTGADLLQGAGMLYGSRIFSYEQLLLDCEIYSATRAVANGIPVSDETLALDVIKEVGAGGNFIAHKHTRQHITDLWQPRFVDRRPYSAWEADRKGPREWANEKARWILEHHQPAPLDPKLSAELSRIISSVEKQLGLN